MSRISPAVRLPRECASDLTTSQAPQKVVVLLMDDESVNRASVVSVQKVIDLTQKVVDSFFGFKDRFDGDDGLHPRVDRPHQRTSRRLSRSPRPFGPGVAPHRSRRGPVSKGQVYETFQTVDSLSGVDDLLTGVDDLLTGVAVLLDGVDVLIDGAADSSKEVAGALSGMGVFIAEVTRPIGSSARLFERGRWPVS